MKAERRAFPSISPDTDPRLLISTHGTGHGKWYHRVDHVSTDGRNNHHGQDSSDPFARLAAAQLEQLIGDAVDSLQGRLKVIYELHVFEGMSFEDIGKVPGVGFYGVPITHAAVAVQFRRANLRVKNYILEAAPHLVRMYQLPIHEDFYRGPGEQSLRGTNLPEVITP